MTPMLDFPLIAPVRQTLDQPRVADVSAETRRLWRESRLPRIIKPGMRVAVGVGSRGIANLAALVRATLDVLRDLGAQPFVVAAMGSHGGATPDGQRALLASYGITDSALGVPVKTDMEVAALGTNSWGETVWWDKNALAADAVVLISRIKPHTDFRGRYESGILKMLVIGLGKRPGAAQHHRYGVRGLRDMMPESAQVILAKSPFVAALAVLENAADETARLQIVEKDEVLRVEPGLLDEARALMGRIPFEQLDLLVIGEIGKNYSGAGIDPNVVGRLMLELAPEPESPRITRICALDLSPESHGNATGVGLADLVTTRLVHAIDPVVSHANTITACFLHRSKVPIEFPTDCECIETGIATCWQPNTTALRMAIIPNTLEVGELWVTEPVLADVRISPALRATGDVQPVPFDAAGNLRQELLFPHSVRARRHP
jgi:Lactate racemase N-terminal domain